MPLAQDRPGAIVSAVAEAGTIRPTGTRAGR